MSHLQELQFQAQLLDDVNRKRKVIKSWQEVPLFWWNVMRNRRWIIPEKEKAQDVFARAKELAKTEIKNRSSKRSNEPNTILSERELAQVIAGKLYVYEVVCQNEHWKPANQ